MNKTYGIWIIIVLFAAHLNAANLPPGFVEKVLVDGLNPVTMTLDHHGNLWLVEKDGKVLIVDREGKLLPDPFIDLAVDDYNERGLLGIALHPDFDNSPYVYVYYTVLGANRNRVSRFFANGNLAVPGSEEVLIELDTLAGFIHNGGAMAFDSDTLLYIATGEAAHAPSSQNLDNLNGKILRLHADGSIPVDNPYYQQLSGKNRAIWAYGFRNPFSFAIDPISDKLFSTDVGSGEYEEINWVKKGKNYGWPQIEGPLKGTTSLANYEDPLYAYGHDEGCSIVGAAFNSHSTAFPQEYFGQFFFADYCHGYIKSLDPQTGTITNFADQINRPLAIVFSQTEGKMYYLTRAGIGGGSEADNTSTRQGQLWEVEFIGSGRPYVSVHPQTTLISDGEDASFQIKASGLPPLSYQWYKNGQALENEFAPLLHIYTPTLNDSGDVYFCLVSNAEGTDSSHSAMLRITQNQRPSPVIEFPIHGSKFQAGDTLYFQGKAFDPEEGILDASRLRWSIDWHHDEHTHPGPGPFEQVKNGSWIVPTVHETDTNVWYRVHLQSTDNMDMSQSTFVDLVPDISKVTLVGPAGVSINVDGKIRTLPHTFYGLIGLQRVVEAVSTSVIGDTLYKFKQWSHGSSQNIWQGPIPPDGLDLELVYDKLALGQGSGLWGSYYNDPLLGFDTKPILERLDSTFNFLWGNGSPDPDLIHKDYFTVRWEGEIQAVFSELYTFHLRSDDGVRLWIGESLVVDKWVPQATTEHRGQIQLEAGKRYPIRLEYFERDGGAEMVLTWSSSSTPKSYIPKRQLYPRRETPDGKILGEVWLDENENEHQDAYEQALSGLPVYLKLAADSSFVSETRTDMLGLFTFDLVPPASYYLQILTQKYGKLILYNDQVDLFGQTDTFFLDSGDTKQFYLGLVESKNSIFIPFPHLKLFPQPVINTLQISFIQDRHTEIEVYILDLSGKPHAYFKWKGDVGSNLFQLDLEDLPSGFYLLKLKSKDGELSRKFIKR